MKKIYFKYLLTNKVQKIFIKFFINLNLIQIA